MKTKILKTALALALGASVTVTLPARLIDDRHRRRRLERPRPPRFLRRDPALPHVPRRHRGCDDRYHLHRARRERRQRDPGRRHGRRRRRRLRGQRERARQRRTDHHHRERDNGTGTGLQHATLADTIPYSEITTTSSDAVNLQRPVLSNAGGNTSTPVLNAGNVTNRSATWTYAYANSSVVSAGTYGTSAKGGRVTYTASMP